MTVLFPFEWHTKEDLLGYYTEDAKTMHVLSMVSCSESIRGWWGFDCEKNLEIRELWAKALNKWSLKLDKSQVVCYNGS